MKIATFCSLFIPLALTAAGLSTPSNPLVGRWQKKYSNGDVVMTNFRPDGSFDAFLNGKFLSRGQYTVKQKVLSLRDAECNLKYTGTYTLRFSSGTDSVHFAMVQDSCRGRRRSIDGYTLGRMKPAKR